MGAEADRPKWTPSAAETAAAAVVRPAPRAEGPPRCEVCSRPVAQTGRRGRPRTKTCGDLACQRARNARQEERRRVLDLVQDQSPDGPGAVPVSALDLHTPEADLEVLDGEPLVTEGSIVLADARPAHAFEYEESRAREEISYTETVVDPETGAARRVSRTWATGVPIPRAKAWHERRRDR